MTGVHRRPLRRGLAGLLALTASAALAAGLPPAPAAAAGPLVTVGSWQFDEPAGATVARNSAQDALHGTVNTNEPGGPPRIVTGVRTDTGLGYQWPAPLRDAQGRLVRDANRLVQFADDPALDPGREDFAVEVRLRTGARQPNVVQKGQSGILGGFWKIEVHEGVPICVFRGMTAPPKDGQPAQFVSQARTWDQPVFGVGDNVWHTLRCALVQHADGPGQDVVLTVDGRSLTSRKNVDLGPIDNAYPMTVGGKPYCTPAADDAVGCDYYAGLVDHVVVERSAPPPPPEALAYRDGSARAFGSTNVYSVPVPSSVRAGDGLVMVSTTAYGVAPGAPTGVTGWQVAGQVVGDQGMTTRVWQRTATAADAGRVVRVPLAKGSKGDLQLLAYAGARAGAPVAAVTGAAETVARTAHPVPAVDVPAPGGVVLSSVADRTSGTTGWTVPGAVERLEAVQPGAGSGRVSSVAVERGPLGAGTAPALVASADVASRAATAVSVVLAPRPQR